MIGVFGKDKRNIHQGTQGKAPLEFQHLGEKYVSMFFFFSSLTSQYQLIVRNHNPGLSALSVERATKCISSLLSNLYFHTMEKLRFSC